MVSFTDLQNGFYNNMLAALALPAGYPLQLFQPSSPLPQGTTDQQLWNFFNNVPPATVTFSTLSGGAQFFSNYSALISALVAPENTFQEDIGPCYAPWIQYITNFNPWPAANSLPGMFRNWALRFCTKSVNKGAADLSAMLLEPVSAAGLALMPYVGDPNMQPPVPPRPANWDLGYATLISQLSNAPSLSSQFSSSTMDSSLSKAWSQSNTRGLFGLWGGSSSQSSESSKFAASEVTFNASFAHVFTFAPTPGSWYWSAAMALAYANKSGPPWNPDSPINWDNTFSPTNGNLARFCVNLIVVDTMTVEVFSSAQFSESEKTTIQNNSGAGMWPFYNSNSSGGSSTSTQFNDKGQMTTRITSPPGVPIILGCTVLPVDQFVGHAVQGMELFAKSSRKVA